jgi:hypothetical protein
MPKGVKRLKTASTRSEQKKNGIPASKVPFASLRFAQNASLFRFASLNIGSLSDNISDQNTRKKKLQKERIYSVLRTLV